MQQNLLENIVLREMIAVGKMIVRVVGSLVSPLANMKHWTAVWGCFKAGQGSLFLGT